MKVLFIKKHSFGRDDIKRASKKQGAEVGFFDGTDAEDRENPAFSARLSEALDAAKPDIVFSSNYFPIVSNCCNEKNIKYISWVYDCPHISLYSYTVLNPCNYIFLFDKSMYDEMVKIGIKNVYYAPLCANPVRMLTAKEAFEDKSLLEKYKADVAFVGRMYDEEFNLYERLDGISDFARGYLEAIIEAQLKVSGYYFVEDVLKKDIVDEMKRVTNLEATKGGAETPEYVFAHYFLGRKITQIERHRLLAAVAEKFNLKVYTPNDDIGIPKAKNMGTLEYEDESSLAFNGAKINLNISLRSIKTGIPLRCFDIIASGGFLLTNYQADFADCFSDGEDYIYYADEEDMLYKIDYFLSHESERKEIAANAYEKLKKYHTYEERIKDILEIVSGQTNI